MEQKIIGSETPSSEKKIKVTVNNNLDRVTNEFISLLNKGKITIFNLKENKRLVNKIGSLLVEKHNLSERDIPLLINSVIQKL